jgi:cysteine desulfurase/selenocysteine lyase
MSTLIFLDNGATSFPKPDEVYRYMDYFFRNYGVNPIPTVSASGTTRPTP